MKPPKISMRSNGVYAMGTEAYFLPMEAERSLQKTDRAWWASPGVILFLTISFSILDGLVLYDIMDAVMLQMALLGMIVAYGIALVLNIIPLVVAQLVHQAIYGLKRHAWKLAALMLAAFLVLFSGTVYLRFAFSERYEPDSSTGSLVNTVETGAQTQADPEQEEQNKAQANAVVLLLSVEPLATSLVNFLLAYLSDDELRARINRLRLRRLELLESISDLQAAQANLQQSCRNHLSLDEERYRAAQRVLDDRCTVLRTRARLLLAEHLADPNSTSRLAAQSVALVEGADEEFRPNTRKET